MTEVICKQCQDRGKYLVRIINSKSFNIYDYTVETKEVYCNLCFRGKEAEYLDNQIKSPDYVNPFINLSDEQILNMINRSSEFDVQNKLI